MARMCVEQTRRVWTLRARVSALELVRTLKVRMSVLKERISLEGKSMAYTVR